MPISFSCSGCGKKFKSSRHGSREEVEMSAVPAEHPSSIPRCRHTSGGGSPCKNRNGGLPVLHGSNSGSSLEVQALRGNGKRCDAGCGRGEADGIKTEAA